MDALTFLATSVNTMLVCPRPNGQEIIFPGFSLENLTHTCLLNKLSKSHIVFILQMDVCLQYVYEQEFTFF
jgi:hypothetical protein